MTMTSKIALGVLLFALLVLGSRRCHGDDQQPPATTAVPVKTVEGMPSFTDYDAMPQEVDELLCPTTAMTAEPTAVEPTAAGEQIDALDRVSTCVLIRERCGVSKPVALGNLGVDFAVRTLVLIRDN